MKLAQRQQREVEGGNWSAAGGQQPREDEAPESPSVAATTASEDDPYRGMSDGEMLQYEF